MRHLIIRSHVFVKGTGVSLLGVCPLPWSYISNAEGLPRGGSSHTHFCVFTAIHRLNSWWLAEGALSLLVVVCGQSEASKRSLLASRVNTHPLRTHTHTHTSCEHTRPANEEVLASEASMALEGKNGSLALGWSLYTCLPPCPKADLGTSIPLLSPKRGIKPETRALLQCQSSTAPGNPSHRKLSAAPTLPSLPLCLLALPHLATYTTTVSTLEEQNSAQYCARMPS